MESEEHKQDEMRRKLHEVLNQLREDKRMAGNTEKGRAVSIAITQLEMASMCIIRSFFADKEYSPMMKLKPAEMMQEGAPPQAE